MREEVYGRFDEVDVRLLARYGALWWSGEEGVWIRSMGQRIARPGGPVAFSRCGGGAEGEIVEIADQNLRSVVT
jgi:hypothetical protein